MAAMRRTLISCLLVLVILSAGCAPAQPAEKVQVITHPDGPLYVGDQVSFEVLTPGTPETSDNSVDITFKGNILGNASFSPFGIGAREEATFWWVWDTHDLKPGSYTLTFTRRPDNFTWTETVSLRPADRMPPPEPEAHWASTTTVCCIIRYITGSAAERDITTLGREADAESAAVSVQMNAKLDKPVELILMPRLIGQGGFTWSGVYATYADDNVIGNDMSILFHHEFVHYYDGVIGGGYRPAMFEEGLAVYLTGGHFKPEPLGPRAAALSDLGWYIPLKKVADDFYNQQHDIGYLEAGALVKYLVETYGWNSFNDFFHTIPYPDQGKDSEAIDAALQVHFGISFEEMEQAYLNYLRSQKVTDDERTDLKLTVEFFDTVRSYQKALDPSAYFLTAWLPDGSVMRQRGIVADLLRQPSGWKNRLVKSQLIIAQRELFSGDYLDATRTLKWVNATLDVITP
jgi:hypothetical protein